METIRILTNQASTGMVVAKDVYTSTNLLLIPKDFVLNALSIARLQFYSIPYLYIYSTDLEEKPTNQTYSEEVKQTAEYKYFRNTFVKATNTFKNMLVAFTNNVERLNTDQLLADVDHILSESRNSIHVFHMLSCMRDFNDLTYAHSLNVALICNVFGKHLKFSKEDVDILTLCGMLHDVGKMFIPEDIINKPTFLTDEEFTIIKTHPVKGYQFLKNKGLDIRILCSALMHHERYDGSGYPNGLKKNQIDNFAKILSIVDTYEAMTASRTYRNALCPFEVINVFETEGYQKYDTFYLITFLEFVVDTYLHNQVRLNDNRTAEIIMINKHSLAKPIVRIGDEFIDLSKFPELSIQNIL